MRIKEMAVARSSPIWKNKGRLERDDKTGNRTQEKWAGESSKEDRAGEGRIGVWD